MAKIPSATSISGPASMRGGGPMASVDTSGLTRGAQALAQGTADLSRGFMSLGDSANQIDQRNRQRTNTVQVGKAEVAYTKSMLELSNRFDADTDWRTFSARADEQSRKAKADAAAFIEDPDMREQWSEHTELQRLTQVDAISDHGRSLKQSEERATVLQTAEDSKNLIADPSTPDPVRRKALADLGGLFQMADQFGMFTSEDLVRLKDTYITKAAEDLARNRMNLDTLADPIGVQTRLGTSSTMNSGDVAGALAAASPKGIVALDPQIARLAAAQLGDKAFPSDPALAAAYLTDPAVNQRYAHAAADLLTTRYKGDFTAAVIAAAPGGGPDLADKWVKSDHDEKVLPAPVREYYRSVMEKFSPTADAVRLPVLAAQGVDLEAVNVAVLDRVEQVQTALGKQVPIIATGGAGSALVDRTAVSLDVSKLSDADRVRLVETASAMGFTGISVDGDTVRLDTGPRHGEMHGQAKWAEDVLARHAAGDIAEVPVGLANVDPRYQALPFDERLRGTMAAKQEAERQGLGLQAGIDVAVRNAPAAIALSGAYDGDLPKAEDFVAAYGAADGIAQFKQFDADLQVAHTTFGMKTMTNAEIQQAMQAAVPTSTGDEAGIQAERYKATIAAGEANLKARDDDPVGYVRNAFPSVDDAWAALGQPTGVPGQVGEQQARLAQTQNALRLTALAQQKLGFDHLTLLPKQMATDAVAAFKNTQLDQQQRVMPIEHMVMQTPDPEQQDAIFDQLVGADLPATTGGAFRALRRNDEKAADYLFRAALFKPGPGEVPDSGANGHNTDDQIKTEVFNQISAPGQPGHIAWGIEGGTVENLEQMNSDMTLIQQAVKQRLMDGSAPDLRTAVEMTRSDLFGDVAVVDVNGGYQSAGAQILLPKGDDPAPMLAGFNALLGKVAGALQAEITPQLSGLPLSNGAVPVLAAARDHGITDVLEEGYFAERFGGYVFMDPYGQTVVQDPSTGEPLVFSRDDVLRAGAAATAAMSLPQPPDAYGQHM